MYLLLLSAPRPSKTRRCRGAELGLCRPFAGRQQREARLLSSASFVSPLASPSRPARSLALDQTKDEDDIHYKRVKNSLGCSSKEATHLHPRGRAPPFQS